MKIILLLFVASLVVLSNAQLQGFIDSFFPWYPSDYTILYLVEVITDSFANTVTLFVEPDSEPVHRDVTMWCMNRESHLQQVLMDENGYINDPNLLSKVNVSKPVAIYIHGWVEDRERTWINDTVRDHLTNVDTNICVADWKRLARFELTLCATRSVPMVGKFLANFTTSLSTDVNLDDVTLIGHSFGAHICGLIGYYNGGSIGRIFGLDPAGPFFTFPEVVETAKRLDPSDAQYVQVIQTTTKLMGLTIPSGHADFYVNCGITPQPKCYIIILQGGLFPDLLVCSHFFSTEVFRYALNVDNLFRGKECPANANLPKQCKKCDSSHSDRLGIHTTKSSGIFDVKTTDTPPFAKG